MYDNCLMTFVAQLKYWGFGTSRATTVASYSCLSLVGSSPLTIFLLCIRPVLHRFHLYTQVFQTVRDYATLF